MNHAIFPGRQTLAQNTRGFALLVSVIFMSVMLGIGLALASLGYKQLLLASTALESQRAFYAADAGIECALFAQKKGAFSPVGDKRVFCGGIRLGGSSDTLNKIEGEVPGYTLYRTPSPGIDLGSEEDSRCTRVTVYMDDPTTGPAQPNYIFAEGFNVGCREVDRATASSRVSMRGLFVQF